MSKINVMIVEDSILTGATIKRVLESQNYLTSGPYTSAEKALSNFVTDSPDIVLMDIELAGVMDGVMAADKIYKNYSVPVIFVSEQKSKTVRQRVNEIEPDGYVLKPFDEHQLIITIETSLARYGKRTQSEQFFRINDRMFIRTNRGHTAIDPDSIAFIEADGQYASIFMKDEKKYTIKSSLKNLFQQLQKRDFIRIHNSFIVNFKYVISVQELTVSIGTQKIPIGRTFKKAIQDRMNYLS